MKINRFAQTAAVAMTLALVGAPLTAQPALAATTITFMNTQAQYDNNPGNGAEAWLWIWTNAPAGGRIVWQHYDGTGGTKYVGHGVSRTRGLSKDIWQAWVCEHFDGTFSCSPPY